MSCEGLHRERVGQILALAGITEITADDVIRVGIGQRHTRRGQRVDADPVPVQLDQTIRAALQICGHTDGSPPAWARTLLSVLHQNQGRGNRRALLTLLLLTGGWHAVESNLTDGDIEWLRDIHQKLLPLPLPPALADRLRRYSMGIVGSGFHFWVRRHIMLATILDTIDSMNDIDPALVHTVTPRQVMQILLTQSLPDPTTLQATLRAVLDHTPVVAQTAAWLSTLNLERELHPTVKVYPPWTLIGCAARGSRHSIAQTGKHTLLACCLQWVERATGRAIDSDTMCNPPPAILDDIARPDHRGWEDGILTDMAIPILFQCWRNHGRDDAIARVTQCLAHRLAQGKVEDMSVVDALIAGVIPPPHGDALLPYLDTIASRTGGWTGLAAGVIYAAACHRAGHLPAIDEHVDRLQDAWGRSSYSPRIAPILAVGRERDLLRPLFHTPRESDRWIRMVLDCIDAMDMLALVGGDPSRMRDVLTNLLTAGTNLVNPHIIIRLAASRVGQQILPHLRYGTDFPIWTSLKGSSEMTQYRIVSHLVSPHWETAPPSLRAWWQSTITRINRHYLVTQCLSQALVLYPTVAPDVAIAHPEPLLIERALSHPRWETVHRHHRLTALRTALQAVSGLQMVMMALQAVTTTARYDVHTVISTMNTLPHATKHIICLLTEPYTP